MTPNTPQDPNEEPNYGVDHLGRDGCDLDKESRLKDEVASETMNLPESEMKENTELEAEIQSLIEAASASQLRPYVTAESVGATALDYNEADISCPLEIVVMASALRELADSTEEHVGDLEADGFTLKAEEAGYRAAKYRASYDALKEVWT